MVEVRPGDGFLYTVEFRHKRSRKHFNEKKATAAKAVTTCTIIRQKLGWTKKPGPIDAIIIENAICEQGDVFSRRLGRKYSLMAAIENNRMLAPVKEKIYAALFFLICDVSQPGDDKTYMPFQQKMDIIASGAAVREARRIKKDEASKTAGI